MQEQLLNRLCGLLLFFSFFFPFFTKGEILQPSLSLLPCLVHSISKQSTSVLNGF